MSMSNAVINIIMQKLYKPHRHTHTRTLTHSHICFFY